MSVLKANCPSCAAPIEFQKGSTIVLVCPFCRSAVARTDRGLDDLGKVAEIVDSESPLKLGLKGMFREQRFELTGRAQMKHELGGVWDEWYATFSNGWVGWLAEAQGKFYLTFYQAVPPETPLPAFENLRLHEPIAEIPSQTLLSITEKGTARYAAADGEIPFNLIPGEPKNFVDLTGKDNAFGTVDYSRNPPQVFVGEQVTLAELGLGNAAPVVREAARVEAQKMSCPNCAGTLELAAPDKSERVTCPFCNSLLDVNSGNLSFLKPLVTDGAFKISLDIGMTGRFAEFENGAEWKVIGAMVRSVTHDGTDYFWHEYLLYNPLHGFRWLTESDRHWNFVEPVTVSQKDFSTYVDGECIARAGGKKSEELEPLAFPLFQWGAATVRHVKGEFYWRVAQGDVVQTSDYISPPCILSLESTENEANWSLGTYVEREKIEAAFNLKNLPSASIVGANQPFRHNRLIRASLVVWLAFTLVTIAGSSVFTSKYRPEFNSTETFTLAPQTSAEAKTVIYTTPVYLKKDASYTSLRVKTDLDYESWSEFSASLVPADAVANRNNPAQVSVKNGVAEPEWSSDSQSLTVDADGEYQFRLEGSWKDWSKPRILRVEVYQRDPQSIPYAFMMIIYLAIVPLILLIYKNNFETRRWENTNHTERSGCLGRGCFGELFSGIFSGK